VAESSSEEEEEDGSSEEDEEGGLLGGVEFGGTVEVTEGERGIARCSEMSLEQKVQRPNA
jgi:hypothetical protein